MSDASTIGDDLTDLAEAENGTIRLDAIDANHVEYRDPYTGITRDIWRPGDGDGTPESEEPLQTQSLLTAVPRARRWRLFQSRTGPFSFPHKLPPRYVMLDDLAAYQLWLAYEESKSNTDPDTKLPSYKLSRYWKHDFAQGKIRHNRPHRGRPAIGDPDQQGEDRYYFLDVSKKGTGRYFFRGEKDFKPVVYAGCSPDAVFASPEPSTIPAVTKRVATSPPASIVAEPSADLPAEMKRPTHIQYTNKKRLTHNQHTPASLLVKNGAPSFAKLPREPRRAPMAAALSRSQHPGLSVTGESTPAATGQHSNDTTTLNDAGHADFNDDSLFVPQDSEFDDESIWVEQDAITSSTHVRPRIVINGAEEHASTNDEGDGIDESGLFEHYSPDYPTNRSARTQGQDLEEGADEEEPAEDTGYYASRLEQQLAAAESRIAELEGRIEELTR